MSIFLAVTVFAQCTPAESIWNPELADQRVCHLSLTVVAITAGICGIFRTTGLTSLSNSQDYLYAISDSAIWTASEVTVTIFCLTLPALRPLYKTIRN
ncbi:hypothetical protein IWW34DRAFT_848801 [Fusarium oxysporum f. sp. albedinis]|nr:hypothetical protein IWW34DRAFT_848801 [Fusarium oxysporum f. sp. albedinis]